MKKLTVKQKRFVGLYNGNGVQAAREAGYKGSDNTLASVAKENLRKPHILVGIIAREQDKTGHKIATREDRQEFWTKTMYNPDLEFKDRLKASELLGRSQADFLNRLRHEGLPIVETHDLSGE